MIDLTTNLLRKKDTDAIEGSNVLNFSDKNDNLTTTLSREVDTKAIEKSNGQNVSDEDEVVRGNDPEFSMSGSDLKHSIEKKPDFQLDYDMFDPLEVARQVAIEVQREVDCREPSCSSSERTSGGGIQLPESPDSIKGKNCGVMHRPCKEVSTRPNLLAGPNLPSERENCIVDIEPTGVNEVGQKLKPDDDKHVYGFDRS